jgi:hypothetical protein
VKIIFSAVLSRPPLTPGSAWHRLNHLIGLRDLGHDVVFVEETYADACVDRKGSPSPFDRSLNVETFMSTMARFGFADRSCLILEGGPQTAGLSYEELKRFATDADLLINMSGHLSPGEILAAPARRMYFDGDPVYTQLWHAQYGTDLGFDHHDLFVTLGTNIGTERSPIPDCGLRWIHTLPPVRLREPWVEPEPSAPFTTVASWSVFGDLEFEGEWYRSRREELLRFASLPSLASGRFEMMVKSFAEEDPEMARHMRASGWSLRDSTEIRSLDLYRDYIDASRAEIGIAKNAYVKGRSGWFSERSAEYLAAGRPVIAQSTGFEHVLPTGMGLLTFESLDEAVDAVAEVGSNLPKHARAARDFVEEYLDDRKVLRTLLDAAGSSR